VQARVKTAAMVVDAAEVEIQLRETGEAMSPDLLPTELIATCLEKTKADPPADEDLAQGKGEDGQVKEEREVENDLGGTEEILKDIDW
jgi:hypothetical protein